MGSGNDWKKLNQATPVAATPTPVQTAAPSGGLGAAMVDRRAARQAARAAAKQPTPTTPTTPTTPATPTTPTTPAAVTPVTPPKTMDARIAEMTGGDSPLMKQATGMGMAFANARGLANSSMAGGAIANEMLKVTAPIASQESQQDQQTALQKLQGEQSSTLQKEKSGYDLTMAEKQGTIDSTLNKEKASQAMALQTLAGNQDLQKTQLTMAADEKKSILEAQVQMSGNYMSSLAQTLSVEKIPADQRAAVQKSILASMQATQGVVEQVYDTDLQWGVAAPAPVTPTVPVKAK